ncbi:hypothetical protein Glove_237g9 [Diversispora epigaea]|uniref:Uncharacterized protein n=1 Tax=Diversispora epigaea TaxID=1348612 RepID=A0A397IAI4_9GLOM|nr:hypothetical protein Glove_237g9 [Diversispora epigaea]
MQDQIILRNHENMMEHFNNNTGYSVSLEPVKNYFWNISNLNIYAATVPDRMHHLDLGLYHYQIEFTKGILGTRELELFQDSKMKFSKFHSWIFHIVDTIREYRVINGYTTETYESLHKSYVKTPYRLSYACRQN